MPAVFICDATRTPFGRFGGGLSAVRTDDLAAIPMRALLQRNPNLDPAAIDDVVYGCANQAGEDNRNVARMALLLAGLPQTVPGATVNRLCGSGMDAIVTASRAIETGAAQVMIAGGVESMSRAPYVMGKADTAFSRGMKIEDSTLGWRFVNPKMLKQYGTDSTAETAENVSEDFNVSREDQDAYSLRSHQRAIAAIESGSMAEEIVSVSVPQRRGDPVVFSRDEQARADTSLEALAGLPTIVKANGTITAGNASGINDGAAAVLLATEEAATRFGLTPLARIVGGAVAGVAPRIMGMGPVPATQKLLPRLGLTLDQMNIIEINEAFASQVLACLRELGVPDDAPFVNANGGAIALGHPLGASGARLLTTATYQLQRSRKRYALCTMCIGVGQGIATVIERV